MANTARPARRPYDLVNPDTYVAQAYQYGFVELPTRSVLDWTPERVGLSMLEADTGHLMRAADLCERIMADARVRGILSTRTLGLFGLPLKFHGAARPIAQLEGTEGKPGDWWHMFPEAELARLTSWGIVLGVGVAQRVRNTERGVGDPERPTLKVWHPRWLRWQWATNVTEGRWFIQTSKGEIPITPGDGDWILYTPYGSTRPWADGAWRSLSEEWIMKQFARHDRARYTEVHGSPMRVGTAPQGATEGMRRKWLAQLRALGRQTSMVLPAGYSMSMVQAAGEGYQVYGATIDLSDKNIAITLTGQTVTTEGSKGFAKGDIHENIARELTKFTAESLSTTLHDQGLKPWAASNYGDPERAPYNTWDITPPKDQKATADTLASFGDAISKIDQAVASRGLEVDVKGLARDFGVTLLAKTSAAPATPNAPAASPDAAPAAPAVPAALNVAPKFGPKSLGSLEVF